MSESLRIHEVRATVAGVAPDTLYIPTIDTIEAVDDANLNGRPLLFSLTLEKPGEKSIAEALSEAYDFPALSIVYRMQHLDNMTGVQYRYPTDLHHNRKPKAARVELPNLMNAVDLYPGYWRVGDVDFIKRCFINHHSIRKSA